MSLEEPTNMEELVYFTNRFLDNDGQVMCWVERNECPQCHKAKMGKPLNPKTGRPKTRAKEYVCPVCNHTLEKKEYEETLTASAKYTCPKCKKQGEGQVPFKRKKVKGADSIIFTCEHCGEKIYVTKKMKKLKE